MADKAHAKTDIKLLEIEAHLSAIYTEAQKGIDAKTDAFFSQFERLDEEKRALVRAGKLSDGEYRTWRKNKMLYSARWSHLKKQLALEFANTNKTALAYVNGELPSIYAINFNGVGEDIAKAVKGYSFELVDADTVKNLAVSDKTLLPYKYLDEGKDVRWNTQKINAAVLQGILQGESIPKLSRRFERVTEMNKNSAIRNARTTVTSAECKGRQDGFERAEADGIKLQREWIAAIDGRTRHTHRLLDGQLADVDKPFESELGDIMYPGDPSAAPANVYNCRCTIAARVLSIDGVKVNDKLDKADRETAQDWWEKNPEELDIQQKMLYNKEADKEQHARYKKRLKDEAPRTFSDFQDMKYRDADKYNDFKGYYRYKGISPDSDRRYYEANKAKEVLKSKGEIKATGTVVKQKPIAVTGKRNHAENQMLVRNITEKDIKNIISGSYFALRQQNGKVFAYYSEDGFAAVDTEGILRTVGRLDKGGKTLFDEVIKYVRDSKQ